MCEKLFCDVLDCTASIDILHKRIEALEERVKLLELRNDSDDDYIAEQNEY